MNSIQYRVDSFFESINKRSFWFLFGLVLLNAILKFFQISDASLWLDEAHTANQALKNVSEIISDSAKDQNPPLYFIMIHFWVKIFGISEFGIRSFSAFMSLITVPVLFRFAKENFNITTAIVASLLFTFSEQQIYFSIEARTYALTGLLCVVSFFIFFRLIKVPSFATTVLLGFTNSLLIYSHFISCFIPVVQVLYLVFFLKYERKLFLSGLLSQLITVLTFFPWIANLFKNIPRAGEYWLAKPSFYNLKGLFISFSNGKLMTVIFMTLISWFIFSAVKKYLQQKKLDAKYYKVMLLFLWFLLPVFMDYFLSGITPIFLNKYLLYSSIGFYLLVGFVLSDLSIPDLTKSIVLVIVLILFIANTGIKVRKPEDWRSTSEYVKAKSYPGDVVILSAACINMPFSYYYDRTIFSDLDQRNDLLNARKIVTTDVLNEAIIGTVNPQSKIIFVQSHMSADAEISSLKILENKFSATERKSFGDIRVTVFGN